MKKIGIIVSLLVAVQTGFTQTYADILRYSQQYSVGDARYVSMGGAFSALGNNFSGIGDNPAGLAVFQKPTLEFTFGNGNVGTNATFMGQSSRANDASLYLGNFGVLGVAYLPDNDMNAKNINYSFSINRQNDYNSRITINNNNTPNSITDGFLYNAEYGNINTDLLTSQAWRTAAIDTNAAGKFVSDYIKYNTFGDKVIGPYGIQQASTIARTGRTNAYAFGIGTNFGDRVYFGATLNMSTIVYNEVDNYSEPNLSINQQLTTSGNGFNLNIGTIIKPVEGLRIGISYHLPTYWSMHDDFQSTMTTQNRPAKDSLYNNSGTDNYSYGLDYSMYTPGKFVGGLAYTFKNVFILSADYEYTNLANSLYSSTDFAFTKENKDISSHLRASNTVKVGCEFRLGSVSLRAGSQFHQSPDTYYGVNDYTIMYSGGIGYKTESFYMDLGFTTGSRLGYELMSYDYSGNSQLATYKMSSTQLLMTLGFRL